MCILKAEIYVVQIQEENERNISSRLVVVLERPLIPIVLFG